MSLDRERLPGSLFIIPHGYEGSLGVGQTGMSAPTRSVHNSGTRSDGHTSQTRIREGESILTMTPEALARTIEDFLAGARDAIVLDDGAAMFDLAQAKYSISGERNKCLLHLWSEERNMVRRVLDVEIKHEVLRLAVQRLGQTRPSKLEICRQRDRRLRPRNAPRAWPTSAACSARWSAAFPLMWPRLSRLLRTWSGHSVRSTPAGCCAADSPASPFWA